MTPYQILDWEGRVSTTVSMHYAKVLGRIGPYEVRYKDDNKHPYCVVCPEDMRKVNCWSVTEFNYEGGLLTPCDDDVELDPYHMCLLYQLVQDHERTRNATPADT